MLDFAATGGELALGSAGSIAGTIAGFSAQSDTLDLTSLTYAAADTVTLQAGNIL